MHQITVTDEACPRCACGYSPPSRMHTMEGLWRTAIDHVDYENDLESPYPSQAQMDAEDREDYYRLIGWLRENREDTRLAGENGVDWAIRLLT
jgi:hypothetical protein